MFKLTNVSLSPTSERDEMRLKRERMLRHTQRFNQWFTMKSVKTQHTLTIRLVTQISVAPPVFFFKKNKKFNKNNQNEKCNQLCYWIARQYF